MRASSLSLVALCVALATTPGCASLGPSADDSPIVWIGKALIVVPASIVLVGADALVEDGTDVSPLDVLTGFDDDSAERGFARDQRRLAERELAGYRR